MLNLSFTEYSKVAVKVIFGSNCGRVELGVGESGDKKKYHKDKKEKMQKSICLSFSS